MGPKAAQVQTDDLFLMRLDGQLKMSHPLIKLANTLDWPAIEKEFSGYFVTTRGRPALPPDWWLGFCICSMPLALLMRWWLIRG